MEEAVETMVFDPLSITAITALITAATPHMLEALRGMLLDKGKEAATDKVPSTHFDFRGTRISPVNCGC